MPDSSFEEFAKRADEVKTAYMEGVVRDHGQEVASATELFVKCSAAAKALVMLANKHKLSDESLTDIASLFETYSNHMTAVCFTALKLSEDQAKKAFDLNEHLLEQLSKVAQIHVKMTH